MYTCAHLPPPPSPPHIHRRKEKEEKKIRRRRRDGMGRKGKERVTVETSNWYSRDHTDSVPFPVSRSEWSSLKLMA